MPIRHYKHQSSSHKRDEHMNIFQEANDRKGYSSAKTNNDYYNIAASKINDEH